MTNTDVYAGRQYEPKLVDLSIKQKIILSKFRLVIPDELSGLVNPDDFFIDYGFFLEHLKGDISVDLNEMEHVIYPSGAYNYPEILNLRREYHKSTTSPSINDLLVLLFTKYSHLSDNALGAACRRNALYYGLNVKTERVLGAEPVLLNGITLYPKILNVETHLFIPKN